MLETDSVSNIKIDMEINCELTHTHTVEFL